MPKLYEIDLREYGQPDLNKLSIINDPYQAIYSEKVLQCVVCC